MPCERDAGRVHARQEAERGRLDVSLDASHLARNVQPGTSVQLERLGQTSRCVDVGVPVNRPVAREHRLRQAGQCAQETLLLADPQLRLEAHHVVENSSLVLLAELDHSVWAPTRRGIAQTHRLHRTKGESVPTAASHLLDGQTPLEEELRFVTV